MFEALEDMTPYSFICGRLVLGDISGTGNTDLFRFLTAIGHLFVESEVAGRDSGHLTPY
jgi:hypothetical protein